MGKRSRSDCLWHLGLDVSLNSTGIALRGPDGHTRVWFFQQRVREAGLRWEGAGFSITCVPWSTDDPKMTKICTVARTLEGILKDLDPSETNVRIESYAFAATTSCLTQLAELGGVVRYTLAARGFVFEEVAPGSLKKEWCQNGRATKEDMYAQWIQRGHPDLAQVLGLKCGYEKPGEDIVDAVALTAPEPVREVKRKRPAAAQCRSASSP